MSYDHHFYDLINDGSYQSALVIAPEICSIVGKVKSVVDWGCGEGAWLKVFKDYGCRVQGYDGDYIDPHRLLIDESEFTGIDLSRRMITDIYDLAISLEVAEHLSAEYADNFVSNICQSSNNILFSAAIPGQKGVGHVNEQWSSYWVQKFATYGFVGDDIFKRLFWNDPRVENWYKQNMIFFTNKPDRYELPWQVFDVVHPNNWKDHYLSRHG
jgi:hypothetical protein